MIRAVFRDLLPVCAVLLLGGGVLWSATDGFRALTDEAARRLHAAQMRPELPAFMLEDMQGRELHLGRGGGEKVTLVGFIYTTCPTICQTAGSDFAQLRDRLRDARLDGKVRLLSVSFDPVRDDPQQMRTYAKQHGADGAVWAIARPLPEAVPVVTSSFGVRVIADEWGGYQHNSAVHMVDTKGRLTGIFDTDDFDGILDAVRGGT